MNRDILRAALLGLAVVVALVVGGWMFLRTPDRAGSAAVDGGPNSRTDADEPSKSADAGPRRWDVPRCPLAVHLDASFHRVETRHKDPNFRARSRARAIQIEIACRRADRDFEPSQFLDETLGAVESRFEGELEGKKRVDVGPAEGFTTWTRAEGTTRVFNVLVRGKTIVTIDVFSPDAVSAREANDQLLEEQLLWPGANPDDASPDAGPSRGGPDASR